MPAARVKHAPPANASATIVVVVDATSFYRPNGKREVLMDDKAIVVLSERERVTLRVAPGEHVIGVRWPQEYAFAPADVYTATVVAEPGRTYYFRSSTNTDGAILFARAMGPG